MTSQNITSVGWAENGSITAVASSGTRFMSDSLMSFQPSMDEPSNMIPSVSKSSFTVETCCEMCCHLPRGSVNRKSTYWTSFSLIISRTFLVMLVFPRLQVGSWNVRPGNAWGGRE